MEKRQKCPACKKNKLAKGQVLCDKCFIGQNDELIAKQAEADKIVGHMIKNVPETPITIEDEASFAPPLAQKEIDKIFSKNNLQALAKMGGDLWMGGIDSYKISFNSGEWVWTNEVKKIIDKERLHGHPEFYKTLDKMKEIHSNKNRDYVKEQDPLWNFKQCENMGIPAWKGCLVRISDKFSRLCSFAEKEKYAVKDESFEDTCIDLANYAVILSILYKERRKND